MSSAEPFAHTLFMSILQIVGIVVVIGLVGYLFYNRRG